MAWKMVLTLLHLLDPEIPIDKWAIKVIPNVYPGVFPWFWNAAFLKWWVISMMEKPPIPSTTSSEPRKVPRRRWGRRWEPHWPNAKTAPGGLEHDTGRDVKYGLGYGKSYIYIYIWYMIYDIWNMVYDLKYLNMKNDIWYMIYIIYDMIWYVMLCIKYIDMYGIHVLIWK